MQKHKGTKEQYEQFVKATVDGLVAQTDFPVIAQALTEAGIADRKMLRKLIHRGVLKTIYVTAGRGIMTGYFTEDVLPKFERERRAIADGTNIQLEQPNTGEGLPGGQLETEVESIVESEGDERRQAQQEIHEAIDYEGESFTSPEGI